jgi:GNAT superfamily N-acetyltransferase
MRLTRLRPATLKRLWSIERTPDAESWVAEVEAFILDGGAWSHQFEPASSILVADESGTVIGAAVHHPAEEFPGARYISALLLDHRFRGRGLGRDLLRAVILDARERSSREYVMWAVHPSNAAMIAVSRAVVNGGVEIHRYEESGYLVFIDP